MVRKITFLLNKHIMEMYKLDPSPPRLGYAHHVDSQKIQSHARSILNKNCIVITKQAALRTKY